jgi:HAMP domain-containing protein
MKISVKLIVTSVLIPVVTIIFFALFIFYDGSQILRETTHSLLDTIVTLKSNQLNTFIDRSIQQLEEVSGEEVIVNFIAKFQNNEDTTLLNTEILNLLNKKDNQYSYSNVAIADLTGRVIFSTNKSEIGKIVTNENYFVNGKIKTTLQGFSYSVSTQKPILVMSSPIKNGANTIGVLVANLNLTEMNKIMTETSGLGETGETYLVNTFNYMVTGSRFVKGYELKKTIYTDGVNSCLKNNSQSKYYPNYQGKSVIGSYQMIPVINVCLIAEMSQQEAYKQIYQLGVMILLIGIISAFLVTFIGYFISRTITVPIISLRDATKQVGEGKLDTVINIKTKDEIADLTAMFNQMQTNLKVSKTKIESYTKELEEKVKGRTEELNQKLAELEKLNKFMVGREVKMTELKTTISELEKKLTENKST